jgi:eukaryotic-like serine/threonine-protein kinase
VVQPGHPPLAGRYELVELLATGGMGQVWRASDLRLGRTVAVKLLRSEFSGNETFLARFRAEARHAAVLAHDGIAAVHDYGEVDSPDGGGRLAFLVMELVDGEPLSELLDREERLDVPRTLGLLRQVAAALAAAHEAGVVHRDVKPGNLLVSPDGRVTVTDFGIAWSAASVPLTQTGQVVGTAHYLSPEQAEGRKAVPASDVYALGMIAYECLAGRRAFDGDSAVQIALRQIRDVPEPLPDGVPDAVRSLVGRMLLKDPAVRFADGAAVRSAVDDVLAGREEPAVAPGEGGTRPLSVVWPSFPAPVPQPQIPVRRRVLGPAVALLAGAGIAVAGISVLAPAAPPPVAAATTEQPETSPSTVVVVAAELVGRPVDDVEARLAALGLRVERVAEETTTADPGDVLAVTPTGALLPGDLVTVTHAVAPPPEAPTPAPTPAPTSAPSRAPTSASSSAPEPTSAAVVVHVPAPVAAAAAPDQGSSAGPGSTAGSGGGGGTAAGSDGDARAGQVAEPEKPDKGKKDKPEKDKPEKEKPEKGKKGKGGGKG